MAGVDAIVSQAMTAYSANKFKAPTAASTDDQKAAQAAQDFEAVFISQMLAPMFEGIKPDSMFGGGNAENIYKSMMIEEYGKILAERGGLGIADSVKATILDIQSKQTKGADRP